MNKIQDFKILSRASQFCQEISELMQHKQVVCSIEETEESTNILIGLASNVEENASFSIIKSKQIIKKTSKNIINKISQKLGKQKAIKQEDVKYEKVNENGDSMILSTTALNQKLQSHLETLKLLKSITTRKKSSSSDFYKEHIYNIENVLNDSTLLLGQYLSQHTIDDSTTTMNEQLYERNENITILEKQNNEDTRKRDCEFPKNSHPPTWLQENDKRSITKLCRLLQGMKGEVNLDHSGNCEGKSMIDEALKGDISETFGSKLSSLEISIDEQIEKEEEEKRLQDIKREKEKNDRAEKLRLKMEEDLKKKQEQDKLERYLALKSLDEMVRELVKECTCPTQFPMVYVSEGRYRIGDSKHLIFVRILRNHVMVRVGGGWDSLQNFLNKHDPCRCKLGHKSIVNAKMTTKEGQGPMAVKVDLTRSRTQRSFRRTSTTKKDATNETQKLSRRASMSSLTKH